MRKLTKAKREYLSSLLGEAIHTAFRKATDCPQSMSIWREISDMPNNDWGSVLDFVIDGLDGVIDVQIPMAEREKEKENV